jgi:hypothetical protein
MIALADIKAALVAILETIPNVDTVNGYGWFQDLTAASIGITIPPLRTESLYGYTQTRTATPDYQSHRFYCEVWVLDDGDPKALDAAMSAINTNAVATLLANQTFLVGADTALLAWFDGDRFDYSITFEVEEGWRRLVNDGPTFLVATMSVPVMVRG